MKKILTFIAFSFLVVSCVFTQIDPKADKIIKSSQKYFNSLSSVDAEFSYTLRNPNLDSPISKKGNLLLSGKKYRILFSEEEFYCNSQTVWVNMIEDEEVTISNYDPEDGLSIDRIYTYYDNNPKNKYDGEINGREKITVFITDKSSDSWKVELFISKTSKLLDSAVIFSRNGTETEYKLTNVKTNVTVTDSDFEFDANSNPDIYINDMREE